MERGVEGTEHDRAGDAAERAGARRDRAVRAFGEHAGGVPAAVWFAPGRVNLIGEHTDHSGGLALPFAIDSGVTAAVGRSPVRGVVRAWSTRLGAGEPVHLAEVLSPPRRWDGGWRSYVVGAVAVLADHAGLAPATLPGLDIVVDTDLQPGAGLSSSAAVECATVAAVADVLGVDVDAETVAALGRRVEHVVVGVPCGPMDQLAAVHGRRGEALLLDCRDMTVERLPFALAGSGLDALVIDTRAHHELADGGYASRRAQCEEAAAGLGVASLRDADPATVESADLDDVLRRRARHVTSENARVLAAAALLRRGRLDAVGELLDASHRSLRDDFEVSCEELDVAAAEARAAGALGARMIGGGFGGSVLALVPAARVAAVLEGVTAAYSRRRWARPRTRSVLAGEGLAPLR